MNKLSLNDLICWNNRITELQNQIEELKKTNHDLENQMNENNQRMQVSEWNSEMSNPFDMVIIVSFFFNRAIFKAMDCWEVSSRTKLPDAGWQAHENL